MEARLLDALAAGKHAAAAEASTEGVQVRRLDWYPEGAAWQIECSRRQMREAGLRELQGLLVHLADEGKISRQEAVSMVPPLLLDVRPGHTVLDLCAAPGSKTGQLLELTAVHGGQPGQAADDSEDGARDGAVVANDVDRERLQMMIARQKPLRSPRLLATNYPGQRFPALKARANAEAGEGEAGGSESEGVFDRVLCDVPCSGDGTLRKYVVAHESAAQRLEWSAGARLPRAPRVHLGWQTL